jgi:hypothetical protein
MEIQLIGDVEIFLTFALLFALFIVMKLRLGIVTVTVAVLLMLVTLS